MSTLFFYGIDGNWTEVTSTVVEKCGFNGDFYIPSGDCSRAQLFTDPILNIVKDIKVVQDGKEYILPHTVDSIITPNGPIAIHERLDRLHQLLNFTGGSLKDEYPEQIMSMMFIPDGAQVLELGSNIGRNTVIIGSILESGRLVTLECDPVSCAVLEENLRLNNLMVQVEPSALSNVELFQVGWNTYRKQDAPPHAKKVSTITFSELEKKMGIVFDTLVVDCEGALYYILLDTPEMLDRINLIIMENDYHDLEHKRKVDELVIGKGFRRVYSRVGGFGPCRDFFFEVWVKESDQPI